MYLTTITLCLSVSESPTFVYKFYIRHTFHYLRLKCYIHIWVLIALNSDKILPFIPRHFDRRATIVITGGLPVDDWRLYNVYKSRTPKNYELILFSKPPLEPFTKNIDMCNHKIVSSFATKTNNFIYLNYLISELL